MHTPGRGEGALRRKRISLPDTSCFVTLGVEHRRPGLTSNALPSALRTELSSIEADGHARLQGATIMPDHAHLLLRTTGSLSLSRIIARLKSKTRANLVTEGLAWQRNFFEHRIRPDESLEAVLRYIVMNPVRSGLVSSPNDYPHTWLGENEAAWFDWQSPQPDKPPTWVSSP